MSQSRRQRQFDHLATPAGIRSVLKQLGEAAPNLIPTDENQLISLLNAVRYSLRKPQAGSHRGRPSHWSLEQIEQAKASLHTILERETKGRVSLQTFISQHLRHLTYPPEVVEALHDGKINKQEATALARLDGDRLQITKEQAQLLRQELLKSHLNAQGSQNQLRTRIKELLGENNLFTRETLALGMMKTDSLLELNRQDVKHVFFETMRDLFYAIRNLKPEDLRDEDITDFMEAADVLANRLKTIELRILQRRHHSKQQFENTSTPQQKGKLKIFTDPDTGQVTYKFS
ncbi:MAG: hypothetical protein HYR56_34170 [Acidobacteria bacterium]|nr:hypothetical protein [Acidobacteriota bacterium]MBI3425617.1 hypothetical protein [Acidobacteriota bacterium]